MARTTSYRVTPVRIERTTFGLGNGTGASGDDSTRGGFAGNPRVLEGSPPQGRHNGENLAEDPFVGPEDVPGAGLKVVYFIQAATGQVKIWRTQNLTERLDTLRTSSPVGLTPIAWVEGDNNIEGHLHWILRRFRLHGEWFEGSEPVLRFASRAATSNAKDFKKFLWDVLHALAERSSEAA